VRVVGSVEINRPASEVWAYVADYGNDPSWRAAVTQMRPSVPGPAQVGVTTHERLRLLGMTFRTDAIIDRVETGRLLAWRAHDGTKRLQGSRLVEPTGPASSRFTEVVEGHLLGLSRPLGPLATWLLQRQATADLRRLKHLLEAPAIGAPEERPPRAWRYRRLRPGPGHDRPRPSQCRPAGEQRPAPAIVARWRRGRAGVPDRSFDLVISTLSMHHWADPRPVWPRSAASCAQAPGR
jgi:Polyketide cyclase / dehydrase and lipid transport